MERWLTTGFDGSLSAEFESYLGLCWRKGTRGSFIDGMPCERAANILCESYPICDFDLTVCAPKSEVNIRRVQFARCSYRLSMFGLPHLRAIRRNIETRLVDGSR